MNSKVIALVVGAQDQPGVLYQLTKVIATHQVNIRTIEIRGWAQGSASIYLELQDVTDIDRLIGDLKNVPAVRSIEQPDTLLKIFGKRVIIIGGGAQVGPVDTIPLVGEAELAAAVRAVARLARARILVMAGALMGGEIVDAVKEIREKGILVISLNMAGGVPEVADLVVSDPVQAGVMAVMAIADTAKFDITRQRNRRY
jgi:energy-converting hydrogenase B subunit Q